MKRLKTLVKRIDAVDENKFIMWLFRNKEFKDFIVKLNTDRQLYEMGVDALGRSLGEYSQATIFGTVNFEGKIDKGQRYDHVTLNDTGKFYESFRVTKTSEGFKITAKTIKENTDLLSVWGEDILGLTEESLQMLIDVSRKILQEDLKKLLLAA